MGRAASTASTARQQERLEATAQTLEDVLDLLAADDPALEALRSQIDIRLDDSGLLIQISDGGDEILFGLASSDLTTPIQEFLARLGPVLGQLSNELQIHGHTDSRPFPSGSSYDNWNLSFARADAARRYLEQHGVRPGQIVGVLAHADSDLLIPEAPLDPRNRRLSILAVRRGAERPAARGRAVVEGDPEAPAADAARESLSALRPDGTDLPGATAEGTEPGAAAEAPEDGPDTEGAIPGTATVEGASHGRPAEGANDGHPAEGANHEHDAAAAASEEHR